MRLDYHNSPVIMYIITTIAREWTQIKSGYVKLSHHRAWALNG